MSDPSERANDEGAAVDATSEDRQGGVLVGGKQFDRWPKDLFIPPDALEVILEAFQGPLDLLLYLIRKQNIDILDIPVAEITRQYMEYVELMRRLRLDLAAEYLVMAAMLAEIKSRMLLPRTTEDGEDEEDPRAALVRRLQEYERFRNAAIEIDSRPRLERDLFTVFAKFDDSDPPVPEVIVTLSDIAAAFQNAMLTASRHQHFTIEREGFSVRERMTQILDRMRSSEYLRLQDILDPEEGRAGLVVSFIAILEMVREDLIAVVQNEPFAPIHIKAMEHESCQTPN